MPIKIPNKLPATETLQNENIFVMTGTRALSQDIRPLRILLLNLMPTKVQTETQLARHRVTAPPAAPAAPLPPADPAKRYPPLESTGR